MLVLGKWNVHVFGSFNDVVKAINVYTILSIKSQDVERIFQYVFSK